MTPAPFAGALPAPGGLGSEGLGPVRERGPGAGVSSRAPLVSADASLQEVPLPGAGGLPGAPVEEEAVAEQRLRGEAAVPPPEGSRQEIALEKVRGEGGCLGAGGVSWLVSPRPHFRRRSSSSAVVVPCLGISAKPISPRGGSKGLNRMSLPLRPQPRALPERRLCC